MKQYLYLVVVMILGLAACRGSGADKTAQKSGAVTLLEQKVIAIHDEAMEKMGTIEKLNKRIDQTIAKLDQEEMLDEALANEADKLQEFLRNANKGMMDWMKAYKAPSMSKMSDSKATKYLTEEQQKIEKVGEMIQKAIQDGEDFLEKL